MSLIFLYILLTNCTHLEMLIQAGCFLWSFGLFAYKLYVSWNIDIIWYYTLLNLFIFFCMYSIFRAVVRISNPGVPIVINCLLLFLSTFLDLSILGADFLSQRHVRSEDLSKRCKVLQHSEGYCDTLLALKWYVFPNFASKQTFLYREVWMKSKAFIKCLTQDL